MSPIDAPKRARDGTPRGVSEFLLVPIGSAGDVLPFLGIGRELRRRGASVAVMTSAWFEEPVRRAGLDFLQFGTREEYLAVIGARKLGEKLRAVRRLAQDTTRLLCERVSAHAAPRTAIVSASMAFGARIAAEKRGLAQVTAHLSPAVFDSPREPPVLPGFFNSERRPPWYRRSVQWLYRRSADALWGGPVRELRGELGLPPARPSHEGRRPSQLALFPGWFAPPQPEWPEGTVLAGFTLYDDPGADDAPADLDALLDGARAPIVFTPGSGQVNARRFFEVAVEASRRLGRPALLLTRFRDQLPEDLPAHARHAPFVPLGRLLPRAAAIVHHGGIGTCAQALASGTPQLVVPAGFDQLDNAVRLRRLGVGASMAPRRFEAGNVERALRDLLESPEVAARCRAVSRLQTPADGALRACEAVERLAPAR